MKSPLQWLLFAIVRLYQLILSPILGPRCRFQPTCSSYALDAIKLHGGLKGGWLALKRITKCHPWGGHGFDPVPGMTLPGSDDKETKSNNCTASGDDAGSKKGTSTDG